MNTSSYKVSFMTLGCRLNQSETAVLEGLFREKGLRVVAFTQPADVVVVNTCTVTAAGDRDARAAVNRAARLNPSARVAVIGCQAQVQQKKLLAWPNVRWVVGTARKMELADIVARDLAQDAGVRVVAPAARRGAFTLPVSKVSPPGNGARTRANIKVQDGCDNFCAYCEVPYARGRSRSRAFDNVMVEARALAAAGYREVVITGVNIGDYADSGRDLADIVRGIEKVPGIERVRVSSLEHARLPLELARLMRPPHKLCRSLHIPLQSGCDRTLRRMGRKHTCAQMLRLFRALKKQVPGLMLGTDIIVGFPGETAEDFERTREFLERAPLDHFHVFSYSARERARSRRFRGAVLQQEIARRSAALRALARMKREAFGRSLLGTAQMVLFEQKKNDYWIGHTDNYVKIKMRSPTDMGNVSARVLLDRLDGEMISGVPCAKCAHDGPCQQDQRPCRGA